MIYAVFILDSSGMPVHTWKHPNAPKTLFKGKDETLVAGLISALLNFGQETFAAPQRINFNDYALTFFTFTIDKNPYWVIAVSDSADDRYATTKFLKIFSEQAKKVLEEASLDQGVFLDMGGTTEKINKLIEATLNKLVRFLPAIRSSPTNSLIVFLPVSILIIMLLNFSIMVYLSSFLGQLGTLGGLLQLALQIVLSGAIVGYLSANGRVGFLNAFIGNITYYVYLLQMQGGSLENWIIVLIIWVFFISPLVGLVGGVVGYFEDIRTLKAF